MARHGAHPELNSGVPPERHERDAERGEHDAHGHVRHRLGVRRAALERERAVVPGQQADEADEHLAQRRVHVEVELALEVVRAELAEVRLVPDDDVRLADRVEARPAREEGVDDRGDVFEVLEEELALWAAEAWWQRARASEGVAQDDGQSLGG